MPMSFVNLASGTASAQAIDATGTLQLRGISVVEDAGSPAIAKVALRNGTGTGDPEVLAFNLAAAQSLQVFPPDGIPCPNGIYLHRVSGTTRATVFYSHG